MVSVMDSTSNGVLLGSISYLGCGSRQLTLSPPTGRRLRRSRTLPSLSFLANLVSSPGTAREKRIPIKDPIPSQPHPESRTHSPKGDAVPTLSPSHFPPPSVSPSSSEMTTSKEVLIDTPTARGPHLAARHSRTSSVSRKRSHPPHVLRPSTSPASSRRTSSGKIPSQSQGGTIERRSFGVSGARRSVSSSRRTSTFNGDTVIGGESVIEEVPVPSMDEMWRLLKDLSGLPDVTGKESPLGS